MLKAKVKLLRKGKCLIWKKEREFNVESERVELNLISDSKYNTLVLNGGVRWGVGVYPKSGNELNFGSGAS